MFVSWASFPPGIKVSQRYAGRRRAARRSGALTDREHDGLLARVKVGHLFLENILRDSTGTGQELEVWGSLAESHVVIDVVWVCMVVAAAPPVFFCFVF